MSDVTIPEDPAVQADIPIDVLNSAVDLCRELSLKTTPANVRPMARAILAETERCAKLIEEGFDKPVGERYADDPAVRSKNDKCPHGRYMYEDCEPCCAQAIRSSHE